MPSEDELQVQREITAEFIAYNPTEITLIPNVRMTQPGGGWKRIPGDPRPMQIGRLVPLGGIGGAVVSTDDAGTARRVDYQLIFPWDAEIEKDDEFSAFGDVCQVVELEPDNGYEVRAQVVRRMARPITSLEG